MAFLSQGGLELMIFLPLPSNCWNYRCVPQVQTFHNFFNLFLGESCNITIAALVIAMQPKLASKLQQFSCLNLPNIGMCHYT